MERIVITGGAGHVATRTRPHLRREGRVVVLVDTSRVPDDAPIDPEYERFVEASITDPDALTELFDGADLVVHLAGFNSETAWSDILATNIDGTQKVLSGARAAGVHRVLLASSVHAVGNTPTALAGAEAVPYPRPDSYYGVGKVALEALGSLFADQYAMMIISVRLGTVRDRPIDRRSLATWIAPSDLARLIDVAVARDEPGHHVIWGMSSNTRGVVDLDAGRSIGWEPVEDAEVESDGGADSDVDLRAPVPDLIGGGLAGNQRPLG